MNWLDRLLGRPEAVSDQRRLDRAEDEAALRELRTAFKRVHNRVNTLEAELERVNTQLRRKRVR